MLTELAPMEGITTYIYRNILNKYYGGVDRYYTPFISTHKDKELNFKEKNEIRPENNEGIELIPQILTADADEFIYTSNQIRKFGYNYVNLNFGCPSPTVTTKGKGSGILRDLPRLERLLDDIFMKTDMKVSVKTRLGYESEDEWENILSIYEKFPLEELIVHARVRDDFYKNNARLNVLADSLNLRGSRTSGDAGLGKFNIKISYNGDIYSVSDYNRMVDIIPIASACMIGRGVIGNPALASGIKNGTEDTALKDLDTFKSFNLELIDKYDEIMPGEKNTLFKLKELWVYMSSMCPEDSKIQKKVLKAKNLKEYELIIKTMEQYL